jgi:hypothetical protein
MHIMANAEEGMRATDLRVAGETVVSMIQLLWAAMQGAEGNDRRHCGRLLVRIAVVSVGTCWCSNSWPSRPAFHMCTCKLCKL